MRIGLLGQFGSGNTGNDGSLEAMLQVLNRIYPNAQLVCICSNPDTISEKFCIDAVSVGQPASKHAFMRVLNKVLLHLPRRLAGFLSAISLAQGIDFIIVPGTGILDDFNENPFGWPFAILRWSIAARIAGTHFAFISVGAGPITHPLSRLFIHKAAMLAAYRSYRDQVSFDFMKSLGVKSDTDAVIADIAFTLPTVEDPIPNRPDQRIGLGIMTYRGWQKDALDGTKIYENYLNKMSELVVTLLAQGRQVRLLTGDTADLQAVQDLLSRLNIRNSSSVIFSPPSSLRELMRQIADTDIVVASRYHNIICALSMGRPTISIGYANKNDALLHDTGLAAFCHHVESFNPKTLLAQIDLMFDQKENLVTVVKNGVEKYRNRLAEQEQILRKTLLNKENR